VRDLGYEFEDYTGKLREHFTVDILYSENHAALYGFEDSDEPALWMD